MAQAQRQTERESQVIANDQATLASLIAEVGQRSGEYPDYLANHLPMVLEAMARLGATPQRLVEYAEYYQDKHKVPYPPGTGEAIERSSWRSAFGDRLREADYRAFFAGEVARLGSHEAIHTYVPVLAGGVAASATHGLMRLAYGVLRNDDTEIGIALGYWAATYLPLPVPDTIGSEEPIDLLLSMRATPRFLAVEPETDLLWHWIRATGRLPEFKALLGRLRTDPTLLDAMRQAALALYAGTMTFEGVHALTGCHWLRLVSPHLDEPGKLAARFWEVVMALYSKISMPKLPDAAQLDEWRAIRPPSDKEIAAAAVASDDEHDHSLVFSALEEFKATGDLLYRVVAARRVGLLPSP
jgi:hypothetical protein